MLRRGRLSLQTGALPLVLVLLAAGFAVTGALGRTADNDHRNEIMERTLAARPHSTCARRKADGEAL